MNCPSLPPSHSRPLLSTSPHPSPAQAGLLPGGIQLRTPRPRPPSLPVPAPTLGGTHLPRNGNTPPGNRNRNPVIPELPGPELPLHQLHVCSLQQPPSAGSPSGPFILSGLCCLPVSCDPLQGGPCPHSKWPSFVTSAPPLSRPIFWLPVRFHLPHVLPTSQSQHTQKATGIHSLSPPLLPKQNGDESSSLSAKLDFAKQF